MDISRKCIIGVREDVLAPSAKPLFSALATLLPVEFRPWTNDNCGGLDALILATQDPTSLYGIAAAGLPVFAVPALPSTPTADGRAEFHLEESRTLDACLRGHRFEEQESIPAITLSAVAGDDVLASQNGKPIWLRRRIAEGYVTMAAWSPPCFSPEDHIYEHFQSGKFLRLLPLLHFLRNLTCQADWQSPPATACLLVDDPNLHSKTYGYLDFRRLASDAHEQRFYVSVATVPMDCWWINSQIGELFCENSPRVSVVLHGNDHTYEELAQPASDAENLALLAHALRRWRRLECYPRMEVCRVMECPHGSLSVAMLEPMARLGYEAVFATTAHLLRCNRGATFRASLGAERTLLERKAVPVIPRIRAVAGWQTEVRLAAFLRKPLILATHHWDFAEQSNLSSDFARIVNGLPAVRWASPTGVARACYQFRQVDDVLHLKLGSRLVDVPIPQSVQQVMIHRPWLRGGGESELLVVRAQENETFRAASSADVIGPVSLQGSSTLQVSSSVLNGVDCDSVPQPRLHWWPLVRKVMIEARDRSRLPVHLRRQAGCMVRHS